MDVFGKGVKDRLRDYSAREIRGKKKKKSFYKQRFNKLSLCNHDKEAHTTVQFRQGHDMLSYKLFGVCFSSSDMSGDLPEDTKACVKSMWATWNTFQVL